MLTIILVHVQRGRACGIRPRFQFVSFHAFRTKKEPQTRVGLVTSSLPRKRSTTELLRLALLTLSFEYLAFVRSAALVFEPLFRPSGAEDGARTRHL